MSASSGTFVLDSSALLALVEDEEGASRVEEVVRQGTVLLPAVVLMEVFYVLRQERGEAEAYRVYAQTREIADEVIWTLDEAILLKAGRFKADHKVSLADAWIAATAAHRGAVLLHKDPELLALGDEVRLETLPLKSASEG